MRRKQYLFHVTKPENVGDIMKFGLRRSTAQRTTFAVHLSENPDSWWEPGMAVLKIRITGLKHEMTTFLPESDEVLVWGDINPERITVCNLSAVFPRKLLKTTRTSGSSEV